MSNKVSESEKFFKSVNKGMSCLVLLFWLVVFTVWLITLIVIDADKVQYAIWSSTMLILIMG